jgi:hypothetical protein
LKSAEKGITERFRAPIEMLLRGRYNFKIAFLYEFQRQQGQVLQHYRQCYQYLASAVDSIDENMMDQIKFVAEIAHFKICNLLLSNGSISEAFAQFRSHIGRYIKIYCEFPWNHFAWISKQFLVFVQLLEKYSVPETVPDADRAYYYHNAAVFTQKRKACYDKIRSISLSNTPQATTYNPFQGASQGGSKLPVNK